MVRPAILSLVGVIMLTMTATGVSGQTYRVDPGASRVTVSVGKSGLFSGLAGHTHQVSGPVAEGTIDLDANDLARSSVRLEVMSAALKVTGADEPAADRPKVQQTMESDKVLDVARYPRIAFMSTAVAVKRRDGGVADLMVTGQLTIRDVTKAVTVPVHVALTPARVMATGTFAVKQSEFGIKPISVAGVVNVKDTLDVALSVAARR